MPIYENPPNDDTAGRKPKRDSQIFGYPGDGVTIVKHSKHGDRDYKVISRIDDRWMYVLPIQSGRVHDKIEVSMADFGMIPYYGDEWHQANWCEIVEGIIGYTKD